jgi:hypothetical protein
MSHWTRSWTVASATGTTDATTAVREKPLWTGTVAPPKQPVSCAAVARRFEGIAHVWNTPTPPANERNGVCCNNIARWANSLTSG